MKWLFKIIIAVVLLAVIAVIILPYVFDPNDHKERIQNLIKDSTGREVALNGEIGWSIFPSLALQFEDVTVSNEKGFDAKHLAQIGTASAQVKLLPLLKSDIQIGSIKLGNADINLQINAIGKSNWESILNNLSNNNNDTKPENKSKKGSLEIRGIEINDGHILYQDIQNVLTAEASNLNIEISAIGENIDTDVQVSVDLNLPETGMKTHIDSEIRVSHLLSDKSIQALLNSLKINGHFSAESDIPFELELKQAGKIDIGKGSLNFPEVKLILDAMKITTPINASNLSDNPVFAGQFSIPQFDLGKLLDSLKAPLNNQADNQLSATSDWSFGNNRLQLKNLDMKLDSTHIKGDVDIKELDQLKGTFSVNVNEIAINQYIPNEGDTTTTTKATQQTDYNFGFLTGTIALDKLIANGATLENISLSFISKGTQFTIQPLRADFYQGALSTQLTLDTLSQSKKMQVNHKMTGIQAGPLLKDITGEDYLTGLGNITADITIDEPFSDNPLQSLNGNVSYRLSEGAVYGIDVFGMMRKGLSLITKAEESTNNDTIKTDFALMNIDAEINNGILQTKSLSISSPFFKLDGEVSINLDTMTVKGNIEPMLINIPENILGDEYKKLINVPIPVSLKGSLLSPEIKLDVKELILATQKEKIDQKKEELKKDLLGKLLGDDKQENTDNPSSNDGDQPKKKKESSKDKLKRDLLNNLLGNKDKDDKKPDDPDNKN